MAERGRSMLLGPSTKRALAAYAAGHDPSMTGRNGTTNGAAMRITVETAESVPTAFGVANVSHADVWEACTQAAALGGDADTIAAMTGAMVGACTGLSALPSDAVRKVRKVNQLDFEPLVDRLLALRRR